MPARTANTYTIPGVGTVKRGKSGRAKSFQGPGRAPAGTTKEPEATYLTTPTVTVSGGKVSASGFRSERAAQKAVRATRKRQRARSYLQTSERRQTRRSAEAEQRVKTTERAVRAKRETSPAPKSPPPKPAPKLPARGADPATAVMSSVPGRGPRVTRQRKQAARKELQQAKRVVQQSKVPADLPHLNPGQEKVARTVFRRGERKGATKKELLAASETGLVESNFRNLPGGDADSEGWRQERRMYYPNPTNVKASADRFFDELASVDSSQTAGMMAADAQRPREDLRGKYDERKPEAWAILKAHQQGKADPKAVKRLRATQVKAEKLGLKVSGPKKAWGPAPKKVVTRYKAIDKNAESLEKMGVDYVYGGGHNGGMPDPTEGLDCSSSTVYVLRKAGVKVPNIVSGEFGNYFPAGPGAVTIFYNDGHVFMRIGKRYFGTSSSNPGSGPGFIEGGYDQSYLSQYNVAHVPGLGKKQALQLGIDPGDFMNAPGITFSNGGTTATVNSGTTQEKAGFSKKPIRVTPMQRYRRIGKRLKAAGVGDAPKAEESPTLKRLEEKYARAA